MFELTKMTRSGCASLYKQLKSSWLENGLYGEH